MKKTFSIPQGTYRIGRDIPQGVYLITAVNRFSFVSIHGKNQKYEH